MKNLFSKPLFWSNVAAFLVTGLVAAGVALAWNNPTVAPIGGSGAITVNSSGNVGIGAVPDAIAKLHVGGDILLDSGKGITLGGVKRINWLANTSNAVGCGMWNQNTANCIIAGTDKIYGVYTYPSGAGTNGYTQTTVLIGSADAPGVRPYSSVSCGAWPQNTANCIVSGTDKIYGAYTFPSGAGTNGYTQTTVLVGSADAPGVTPYSSVDCGVWQQNTANCIITGNTKVYGAYTFPSGAGTNGYTQTTVLVGSADAPGVASPQ